jgi:simple sugar transport system ATP-binding protein
MAEESRVKDRVPRIELRGIHKSFGAIDALKGVDLSLYPGEVLGLVGDNGAGKSTLMKILSGAQTPDEGRILLEGEEVGFDHPRDARARRIEMVYQDLSLCEDLDVAGNIFLGREPSPGPLRGFLDRRRMHREAAETLGSLGIRIQYTDVPVRDLSGGQRQSVAIARALSFDPLVLIMDEPTAALAVREVEQVLELIKEASRRGVSVVLITHRLQDLFRVCDRLTVMYEGTVAANLVTAETTMEQLVRAIVGEGSEAA